MNFHAQKNAKKLAEIQSLRNSMRFKVSQITHSHYSTQLLDAIFANPTFRSTSLRDAFKDTPHIHQVTMNDLLRKLSDANILDIVMMGSGRRPTIYRFTPLLAIIDTHKP